MKNHLNLDLPNESEEKYLSAAIEYLKRNENLKYKPQILESMFVWLDA
jgi:hypothetical protein